MGLNFKYYCSRKKAVLGVQTVVACREVAELRLGKERVAQLQSLFNATQDASRQAVYFKALKEAAYECRLCTAFRPILFIHQKPMKKMTEREMLSLTFEDGPAREFLMIKFSFYLVRGYFLRLLTEVRPPQAEAILARQPRLRQGAFLHAYTQHSVNL